MVKALMVVMEHMTMFNKQAQHENGGTILAHSNEENMDWI
jgi:hypothetical protein